MDAIQVVCHNQVFFPGNPPEKDLPADEATDVSSDKTKKAARDRNLMAISCLTMAFQDDALLNMIEQSETSDWPSGLAYRVVDELFKKHRPVDIISRVEMRTKLSQVSMKSDDDPKVLFNQLATIQSAYNNATQKIDPFDLIAVVLEKAPNKYKSSLTAEQRNKGTNLTLTNLNNCMNDLFRTMTPNHSVTKDDNEVALTVTTGLQEDRAQDKRLLIQEVWECQHNGSSPMQALWGQTYGPQMLGVATKCNKQAKKLGAQEGKRNIQHRMRHRYRPV
jgi:hypothetical protein